MAAPGRVGVQQPVSALLVRGPYKTSSCPSLPRAILEAAPGTPAVNVGGVHHYRFKLYRTAEVGRQVYISNAADRAR